jgi:hypothetical protein
MIYFNRERPIPKYDRYWEGLSLMCNGSVSGIIRTDCKMDNKLKRLEKAIDNAEKEYDDDPSRENEAFLSGLQVAYEIMGGVL